MGLNSVLLNEKFIFKFCQSVATSSDGIVRKEFRYNYLFIDTIELKIDYADVYLIIKSNLQNIHTHTHRTETLK